MTAGKLNEFESASGECTLRRGPGDRHAAAASKLEETLVAQLAERAQHRVSVDVEDGGEVLRRR